MAERREASATWYSSVKPGVLSGAVIESSASSFAVGDCGAGCLPTCSLQFILPYHQTAFLCSLYSSLSLSLSLSHTHTHTHTHTYTHSFSKFPFSVIIHLCLRRPSVLLPCRKSFLIFAYFVSAVCVRDGVKLCQIFLWLRCYCCCC